MKPTVDPFVICPACEELIEITKFDVDVKKLVGVRCFHCGHILQKGDKTKIVYRISVKIF